MFFDFFRDVIGEFVDGERSGAWGVFEDKGVFVFAGFEEFGGGGEIFIGFGGEADDEIGGDGGVGEEVANAMNEFQVFLDGVIPVHEFKDTV